MMNNYNNYFLFDI